MKDLEKRITELEEMAEPEAEGEPETQKEYDEATGLFTYTCLVNGKSWAVIRTNMDI